MNINRYDVVIIGGGYIGLAVAIFLGKVGLQVIVIEKDKITSKKSINRDFRTTAISEGTKKILDFNGIWKKLKSKAQPIKKIRVFDRHIVNKIDFMNPKKHNFLGYIVENKYLKEILIKEINSIKNILIIQNSLIKDIEINEDEVTVRTNTTKLNSSLLIASDGKNSFVRKKLKESIFFKQYNHSALVMNFVHTKDHKNTAYEIFLKSGPLAILPMQSSLNKKFRSSVIWSHNHKFINNINSIDNNFLLSLVNEYIQKYVGTIKKIENKKTFVLSAHINSSFGKNRIIYIGDAAHSIHPIAGQGWNLGMRDCENLKKIIIEALDLGLDIGSEFVCKEFNNARYFDIFSLYQITDKLNSIFMNEKFIFKKSRQLGLGLIDYNKNINNYITKYAMGDIL